MGEFDGVINRIPEMTRAEKTELCEKLRKRIIDTVLENGGHLSSNLGVVELTVGLYSVLDPYKDRVIWDVGHQCYAHKLLTGRDDSFCGLRQEGGISGFPVSAESEADAFDTGHSSTSISAAIGFARARNLTGQDYRVCAVIGDGASGSGMVYEAFNDAGRTDENIIVILNDNGMSISPNVGAFSKYLQRTRNRKGYLSAKRNVKGFLDKIPKVGPFLVRKIEKVKSMLRAAAIPDGVVFEELGWKYIGRIDGHDPEAVADAVRKALYIGGPVLIHAITQKGKGYAPAEADPVKYHGVKPAALASGNAMVGASRSFSANLGDALCSLAESDEKIVAVSAAMVDGTGLAPFTERFPKRYIDVGISEEHAVTMCAALAKSGLRPFLCLYSTFAQRSYDQLLHDVALPGNPVVLCLDRGGVSGPDGRTHQGVYDLSYLGAMPGFTVCAPATLEEQAQALTLAAESDKPFAIRYPARERHAELQTLFGAPMQPGKGIRVYSAENPQAVIIALGVPATEAVCAAQQLEAEGIGVNVFSARFLKPLDIDGIAAEVLQPGVKLCVTVEDGVLAGGFGQTVLAALTEKNLKLPRFEMIGFPDEGIPHGSISNLYAKYGLDAAGLAETVRGALANAT